MYTVSFPYEYGGMSEKETTIAEVLRFLPIDQFAEKTVLRLPMLNEVVAPTMYVSA